MTQVLPMGHLSAINTKDGDFYHGELKKFRVVPRDFHISKYHIIFDCQLVNQNPKTYNCTDNINQKILSDRHFDNIYNRYKIPLTVISITFWYSDIQMGHRISLIIDFINKKIEYFNPGRTEQSFVNAFGNIFTNSKYMFICDYTPIQRKNTLWGTSCAYLNMMYILKRREMIVNIRNGIQSQQYMRMIQQIKSNMIKAMYTPPTQKKLLDPKFGQPPRY